MAANITDPTWIAEESSYHYIPSFSAGVALLTLFALTTGFHMGQAYCYRLWWLFPTVVTGGIGEIIGWSGRVWSSRAPLANTPFMMQITTTIISPTFILAANFIIVGKLIRHLGPQYSRLKPRLYTVIFCTCDVTALVIQAVGGATASSASTPKETKLGANIMLAGIGFQLGALILYFIISTEFILRLLYKTPFAGRENTLTGRLTSTLDAKLQLMMIGIALNSVCMLIRGVYRTIELSDGWNGRVISTEIYFIILDGVMIFIAMASLNVFHPGFLINDINSSSAAKE